MAMSSGEGSVRGAVGVAFAVAGFFGERGLGERGLGERGLGVAEVPALRVIPGAVFFAAAVCFVTAVFFPAAGCFAARADVFLEFSVMGAMS